MQCRIVVTSGFDRNIIVSIIRRNSLSLEGKLFKLQTKALSINIVPTRPRIACPTDSNQVFIVKEENM